MSDYFKFAKVKLLFDSIASGSPLREVISTNHKSIDTNEDEKRYSSHSAGPSLLNQKRFNWLGFDEGNDLTTNENEDVGVILENEEISQIITSPSSIEMHKEQEDVTVPKLFSIQNVPIYKHNFKLISNTKPRISLMFLHQNKRSSASLMNKLAAFWTQSSIIHVEIFFDHDQTTCSVSKGRPVAFNKGKIYSQQTIRQYYPEREPQRWECITLSLDVPVYDKVYQFCRNQVGAPFDVRSIYLFPCMTCVLDNTMTTLESRKGYWICSKLVCASLQYAGILGFEYDQNAMTPAGIKDALLNRISSQHHSHYDLLHTETVI